MIEFQDSYAIPSAHSVVILQGGSGHLYGFTAFPMAAPIRARGGICVCVRPPEDGDDLATFYWTPLYVGASHALGEGDDMPRGILEQARRMGATHMLVHFCDRGEDVRRDIAEDLIAALRPALNSEGRRAAA